MASHTALIYPDSPYVIPDFEESTTDKLTCYLTVGQKCLNKLRPRHRRDDLTQRWNTAQVHWQADPANPSSFPLERLTAPVVNDFYHKCDSICVGEPESDDVDELMRIFFAAHNGAQFIIQCLLFTPDHPLKFKIKNTAGDRSLRAFHTSQEIHDMRQGRSGGPIDASPALRIRLGDILHYMEGNQVCSVRVKDHGRSALKGEFFVVTPVINEDQDDSLHDMEVALGEMEAIIERQIQA